MKTVIDELLEDQSLMKVIDDILYLMADTHNVSHSKACELIGELGMIAKVADLASYAGSNYKEEICSNRKSENPKYTQRRINRAHNYCCTKE